MRQVVFRPGSGAVWGERPDPAPPGPLGAHVRPLTVSTCDYDGLALAGFGPALEVPLGHEGVGRVTEVGAEVTQFAVGDLVVVPWKVSCGTCRTCRRGRTAHCETVPYEACYGWGHHAGGWGGFLADVVVVPWADHMLTAVPDGLDLEAAAGLSDNIVDGWRAVVPPLRHRSDGSVLVAGAAPPGSIGLLAVAVAAAVEVERLVYVDGDEDRRAIAAAYGADTHDVGAGDLADALDGERFDVTVDASGDPALLAALVRRTARAGHVTSTSAVAHIGGPVELPTRTMYRNSLTFTTGWVDTNVLLAEPDGALELLRDGRLDVGAVVEDVIDADEAVARLNQPFRKLVIRWPDEASA